VGGNSPKIPRTNGLTIYPNPTTGSFKVDMKDEISGPISIVIYDKLNRVVYSRKFDNLDQLEIQGDNWKSGIYTLIISSVGSTEYIKIAILH
jgi:hypothetical protein